MTAGWIRTSQRLKSPTGRSASTRRARRRSSFGECLEDRHLLAASLAPIPNASVPSLQGLTIPLDGSGTPDPQTFSATSTNPDIAVSIASTTFWSVGISYTDPVNSNNSFTGTLTFALFGNLTPNTAKMITEFTSDNYYVNSGKFIWRVASNFDATPYAIIEGGVANSLGNSGASGQPNTPFPNENNQALAPTGSNQLLLANTGGTDSNDAQFFINTGPLDKQLGYGYTLFGQLVSGAATLAKIAQVPVTRNDFGETSQPVNPITITSTSLSTSNDSGALLIDTTQAYPGETATVTVTAHDGSSSVPQSFQVTVGPYAGSNVASVLDGLNVKPFASPMSISATTNIAERLELAGQPAEPLNAAPVSSYTILTGPAHGTISYFNLAKGQVLYTSVPGFVGTDSFTYTASSSGPNTGDLPATSNPATVTITVHRGYTALTSVEIFTNGRRKTLKIELYWSGPLNPSLANSKAPFEIEIANRRGSFTGKGVGTIAIRKVHYDGNADTVTLTPRTLFSTFKTAQVLVHGFGPKALKDSTGLPIFGDNGPATDTTWNLTYL